MSSLFIFPKPQSWSTFEDITCDVFSRQFGSYNLQRYGRSGQSQGGVDIVGRTPQGLLGIQCKHHPDKDITISEIDKEIKKADKFTPKLDEFFIATSASKEAKATNHVLTLEGERVAQGKFPVRIKFWEDIYDWLSDDPNLVYKHFTRYFPTSELVNVHLPGLLTQNKQTLRWPATLEDLRVGVSTSLGDIRRADPYQVTFGLTNFPDITFEGLVDLEVHLDPMSSENSETSFSQAQQTLRSVKAVLANPFFSKNLVIHLQTRLSLAFLFGWTFRRVTNFDLTFVVRDSIWVTSGVPQIPSALVESVPKVFNQDSGEVALVLSISRDIEESALAFIETWTDQPKAVVAYRLANTTVSSSAHALSIAQEVSQKIKTFIDVWKVQKIHLFGAMPAGMAALIGYHLNAICPIYLYYRDESRTTYQLGGIITNET